MSRGKGNDGGSGANLPAVIHAQVERIVGRSAIGFALDRSGSMEQLQGVAIEGFNVFLKEQQALPGEARMTLVHFHDIAETIYDAVPLRDVRPHTLQTYRPGGGTVLRDGICYTISSLRKRIARMPEEERPTAVMVVILTDGIDNSGQQDHTWDDVQRMVREQQQEGWVFRFYSSGPNVVQTAQRIGIPKEHTKAFASGAGGLREAMGDATQVTSFFRTGDLDRIRREAERRGK